MRDLGEVTCYLGIEVKREYAAGTIKLSPAGPVREGGFGAFWHGVGERQGGAYLAGSAVGQQ